MPDQQQQPPPSSPSIAASPHWAVPPKEPAGFTPFVAFCFTVNYILGAVFLTIPWAFVQSGVILSSVLLFIVCIFADVAKNYLLETMARAEAMLDERMRWIKKKPGGEGALVYSPSQLEALPVLTSQTSTDYYSSMDTSGSVHTPTSISAHGAVVSDTPPATPGSNRRAMLGRRLIRARPSKQVYLVKSRKFEINTLCRIFLGKKWGGTTLYMIFLSLYLYCTLWAYASVFASAMARQFPNPFPKRNMEESTAYIVYAILFGMVVVPMSCLELHEQIAAQVFLTGCRFVMVFLMVATSSLCDGSAASEPPLVRPSGMDKTLPILVFATIYHHSIPGLAHPVADKKKLSGVFRSTTVFSGLAYTFIGVVLALAFGENVEQSSNLNWHDFGKGVAVDEEGEVLWWVRAISLYVICFPAIDVLSAFPLNAITLGNNMLSAFYGRKIHDVENNRSVRIRFRLLASIPPIILAILIRELGTISDYAGTTGFILTFTFPALLYIQSTKVARRKNYSIETYYTSYASNLPIAITVFGFGVVMLCFVIILVFTGH